jgi:dual-specificity kinase
LDHFCLVFQPLGLSLYELIKKNNYRGFPLKMVQSFLRQIFKSVGFLHKLGYTHTDLKPENILLEKEEIEEDTSKGYSYFLPKSNKIRLIDFGGATLFNEAHSTIICTRQYRPPEVILECCQWN